MLLGNSTRTALSCISTMRDVTPAAPARSASALARAKFWEATATAGVSPVALADLAQGLVDQGPAEVPAQSGKLRQSVRGPAPGLRVALSQQGHDHLLEDAGLPVGGVAPGPQMAGLDAVLRRNRRPPGPRRARRRRSRGCLRPRRGR